MPQKTLVHHVLVALQVATVLCLPLKVEAQDEFDAPRPVPSTVPGPTPALAPAPVPAPTPTPAAAGEELIPLAAEERPQGLRLSSQGALSGRFMVADGITGKKVPARKLSIRVLKDGQVVSRTRPGAGGVFQVKKLGIGAYSIVAEGPDGYFSSKFRVLPAAAGTVSEADQALQIDAAVVHPINAAVAKSIIRNRFLPVDRNLTRAMAETFRGDPRDGETVPLVTPLLTLSRTGELKVRLSGLTPGKTEQIRSVRSDGYLLQGGKVVGQVTSDATGVMQFEGIRPGAYSFVVLNVVDKAVAPGAWSNQPRAGFVAMGVQVVGGPTAAAMSMKLPEGQQFVQADGSDVNEIEGVDSTEGEGAMDDSAVPPDELPPPGPGGGMVAGGGGGPVGGGGGGGGGGLGLGLAGLAAGAGIAAALAANDDNNGGSAAPASPAANAQNVNP
ncbi:hypothetical protein [Planctomyces sp. SH-PL14]|uniref:hypothetical protein n=1 Tax=Planctomyces sp. SH-PL14 TaxID=1632864 RepID=UPI00078D9330|nr:hypothetical protein [Planctomyces sp. SH-PL14]AMV16743.1 hypothetical protein VT03_02560 [Planctomyces sp. SH-PL14]